MGRKLIEESNCIACHKIDGYEKQWAPSLDGIGSKVNRTWLVNWLKNPRAYFAKTKMPNFLFTDEEANILADFLITFKAFPNNVGLEPLPKVLTSSETQRERFIELGSTRFREARCISCHSVDGKGGYVATELGKSASKINVR